MILVYTYYSSPWKTRTGDDIRIHTISKALVDVDNYIVVFNLSHYVKKYNIDYKDSVIYVTIPRKFYRLVIKILKWKETHDLNTLIKLTHYIDEFITAVKILQHARKNKIIYVFGSMTLLSLFMRLLGVKSIMIYDPLANYAQTLYFRSRKSIKELLRYGLYLIIHKLQLKNSDYVVYPSKLDHNNAIRMFNLENDKVMIIPNPIPVFYDNTKEYLKIRQNRNDFTRPYFILLAGSKNKANEEAVKITIDIFNEIPSRKFKLLITGPWLEMKKHVHNPSIKLLGIVPSSKIKELLAISDYGLSPIFSHTAGTFLKILAYIASGLNVVATPQSLIGVDPRLLKDRHVFIIKNNLEYRMTVLNIIRKPTIKKINNIIIRNNSKKNIENGIYNLFKKIMMRL